MVEDLQKVADLITAKLNAIERYSLLSAKNVLNLDDVAMLTGLSKSHLYKLTCNKQIPHYKPNTKAMYFDRVEIEEWMKQNRVTTQAEAEQQALAYVVKKGGAK
jgi:excisionase family DNA binding protein